ncbi:MAG: T9SS type A sorting domain-containing protein [Bacteroidales bacterium]|nr:T9SS type A sorting domain-containing protein [Bacteroidales bacterium]
MKKILLLLLISLSMIGLQGWGQTSTQNFGTGTGSQTSQTGVTNLFPNPTSGTTWARAGATTAASINLVNTSNPLGTTGSLIRAVASTTTSVAKFSPWVGYTGSTEFYTSFKVLFGDASAGSTATSGSWTFYQGAGAMYSDANDFAGAQVFASVRFTFGTSGVITLNNRAGGSWSSTITTLSSATVYTIEIVGNNKTSGTINYTYGGVSQSVAVQKFDLYINGTLIGDDLAEAQLPANTNVTSGTFIGISSTSSVANIFVDNVITYNAIPSSINNFYSKPSSDLDNVANWGTKTDGTGASPTNFTSDNQSFTIKNNTTPTISTDWTVSGTNSKIVIGDGINSCNFTAAYNVSTPDLEINTNGVITLNATKSLTVSGTLTNNATASGLVIESDATGTGSLIHSTASINATFKRYMAAATWTDGQDGWHFLSSPVANHAISTAFTVSPADEYDFYAWSEVNNTWVNFKSETSPTFSEINGNANFTLGKGYMTAYKNTDTKVFSGALNVGDVSFSNLTVSAGTNNSWHLLGNPFSSALTWDDTWTTTNINGVAKIWNEGLQGYSDISSGGVIPVNNGFLVKANSSTNNITIPASNRLHSGTAFYKSTGYEGIKLTVYNLEKGNGQETKIFFNNMASNSYDVMYDCDFLPGYGPRFYSEIPGYKLSTNTLTSLSSSTEIPLTFVGNQGNNFRIDAEGMESLMATVYLNDLKTGNIHNLSANPSYAFTSTPSDDPNRFKLTFASVGIENPETENPSVYTYGNQIFVKGQGRATIELYNMSGQRIYAAQTQLMGITPIHFHASAGYYIVRVIGDRNVQTSKILLNN